MQAEEDLQLRPALWHRVTTLVEFSKLSYTCKYWRLWCQMFLPFLAYGRSENSGVPVLFGGHNLLLLVEIGLTDLPKSGGRVWQCKELLTTF